MMNPFKNCFVRRGLQYQVYGYEKTQLYCIWVFFGGDLLCGTLVPLWFSNGQRASNLGHYSAPLVAADIVRRSGESVVTS